VAYFFGSSCRPPIGLQGGQNTAHLRCFDLIRISKIVFQKSQERIPRPGHGCLTSIISFVVYRQRSTIVDPLSVFYVLSSNEHESFFWNRHIILSSYL